MATKFEQLMSGETVIVKKRRSPLANDDWSDVLYLNSGKIRYGKRNCFSENCNCLLHDPWIYETVSEERAKELLGE